MGTVSGIQGVWCGFEKGGAREQVGSFRARMNAVFTMYRPGGSGASFSLAARGSVWRGSDHSMTNVFPPTVLEQSVLTLTPALLTQVIDYGESTVSEVSEVSDNTYMHFVTHIDGRFSPQLALAKTSRRSWT